MTFRRGVRLGVDVGEARVGLARSDAEGVLVIPVRTLRRDEAGADAREIAGAARDYAAIEVVVGLPLHLRGVEGASAALARMYASRLAGLVPEGVSVRLVDERLSSEQAHRRLRDAGVPTRLHRAMVDQVAAQVILEQALEQERHSGAPPGTNVWGGRGA